MADDRGQPFGRLVEDQQPRICHQRPPDSQHLLFAARQVTAGMVQSFAKPREQLQHGVQCPAQAAIDTRTVEGIQILGNAEIGENLPAFRHQPDTGTRKFKRFAVGRAVSKAGDAATTQRQLAHDGADRGGLAHAVAPHQRHAAPGLHLEAHPEEDLRSAIACFDPVKPQHRRRSPDRRRGQPRHRRSRQAFRWRSPPPRQEP